ncbi:hypothetical protein BDV97DRAFT_358393 [Delphinella strobiligena]|nr:hypothetical protein BDV97DRAFT_358393 [Delphinella strobiligena]
MEAHSEQPFDCINFETGNQAQNISTTNCQTSTASTNPIQKAPLPSNIPSRTVKKSCKETMR